MLSDDFVMIYIMLDSGCMRRFTSGRVERTGLSKPQVRIGNRLTVSADITNSGSREADEVAQLYTRELVATVNRPVRELKGFHRVHLKPGKKASVTFRLSTNDLAFYNERKQLVTEPGTFHVWIAADSARGLEGEFAVK